MQLHQANGVETDYSTPFITFEELPPAEAAQVALLDLAFSDDEWLHEQETTEFRPRRGDPSWTNGHPIGSDLDDGTLWNRWPGAIIA